MIYSVTKTYGDGNGFSCAFRNHRAKSHCRHLHGYALQFSITFAANELDSNGWVIDFGGLKEIKQFLTDYFDHKTLVAVDDPFNFNDLNRADVANIVFVPGTGCEAFATLVWKFAFGWLVQEHHAPRVKLIAVECREHAGNLAGCYGDDTDPFP